MEPSQFSVLISLNYFSDNDQKEKEIMAEIPFWVHDRPKWVSGITATTTCREILISLAVSIQEDVKKLILTEKWHDVERPLNNDSKILPIWNSWGEERKHVRIVVKRVKNHHKKQKWKRRGSISSMASVDEMHPKALDVNSEVLYNAQF